MTVSDKEYPVDSRQEHEIAMRMVSREGHYTELVGLNGNINYEYIKVMRVTDGVCSNHWESISVWLYEAWLNGEMPEMGIGR